MAFSVAYFILAAIEMAQYARDKGDDPFGAVLVYNGQIVHKSYDRSIELCDPASQRCYFLVYLRVCLNK